MTKAPGYELRNNPGYQELSEIQDWMAAGDLDQLTFAMHVVDSFPHGHDGCFGTPWIVHAAGCGSVATVTWMVGQGVNVRPTVTDGYPPLLACLEDDHAAKYATLDVLIAAGADLNARGINGWTALHMAAIQEDERAMRILLTAGADRSITTLIDDDATPEEEARLLGHSRAAAFIAAFEP